MSRLIFVAAIMGMALSAHASGQTEPEQPTRLEVPPPAQLEPAPPPPRAAQDPGPAAKDQTAAGALRASDHTAFGSSGSPPPPSVTGTGFDFGSYGRVSIGSDLRGHTGHGVNVVSFGSRLEKPTYLEVNFFYGGTIGDDPSRRWRVVIVPAFAGDLFHFSGNFSQHFALRNAYAETENLGARGLRLWAGSRMYRGDDVYLFDFWPLDNLNTVGGGAGYNFNRERTDVAVQIGMNRLDDLYQHQQIRVPARRLPQGVPLLTPTPATMEVTTLDRPRLVVSFKGTQFLRDLSALPNAKLVLYGEFHYLPAGERQFPGQGQPPLVLPEDYGGVIGAQVGSWLRPFVFANLFLRAAFGLAAFGDLGRPYGFDQSLRVSGARELTVALSANWESKWLGLMSGAYFRVFRDASQSDGAGFDEGAMALRPTVYFTRYLHTAVELSYQARRPVTVDQETGAPLLPQVFRLSLMPLVAPLGRGTYSRPFLYGIYTMSLLNADAQHVLFDPQDVRAGQSVIHYLGLGAEWWFNSSYR
ncbi:MAG: carbohydrate porin [Myxococcales bacterium]|nr:carbohydrate porin [Myxococcota bacterium]MDW8284249.1 carbohydrate porin [Myxococcales bacterium]